MDLSKQDYNTFCYLNQRYARNPQNFAQMFAPTLEPVSVCVDFHPAVW